MADYTNHTILMVYSAGATPTMTFQSLNGEALPACLDGMSQPTVSNDAGVSMLGPVVFNTNGKNFYLRI